MKNILLDKEDLAAADRQQVGDLVMEIRALVQDVSPQVAITGLVHALTLAMLAAGVTEGERDGIVKDGWDECTRMLTAVAERRRNSPS